MKLFSYLVNGENVLDLVVGLLDSKHEKNLSSGLRRTSIIPVLALSKKVSRFA